MKILFVCLGNICRSPAGENVLNHLITQQQLDSEFNGSKRTPLFVDSAGTANYHSGSLPDSRMIRTLESRNINVTGCARQFTLQDFKDFDLILTMDYSNYEDVISLTSDKELQAKVKPFASLLTEHDDDFIPDPYTDGQAGFDYVVDLMFDGCSQLLKQINNG